MMGQRGFALLIVLLTMGFLALIGTRMVAAARFDIGVSDNLRQAAMLQAAAEGAVAQVVFAIKAAQDPRFQPDGLPKTLRIGPTPVTVHVWNESDRVNLNTASVPLLRALLIQVGIRPAQADQLAGAIHDWRTTGPASQDGGPKAPRYQAAGLPYTPPNTPFVSVQDLADVLGMTPELFNRLADHVTVLTAADPDASTHDPFVAQALAQVADTASPAAPAAQPAGDVLRVVATAVGLAGAHYTVMEVASGDFQAATSRVRILARERLP